MKIVHQKYCPYHNDEDTKYFQKSHIYCRRYFSVCIPGSVAVGGDQIMSYGQRWFSFVFPARAAPCRVGAAGCSRGWNIVPARGFVNFFTNHLFDITPGLKIYKTVR